jgi:hypothetical protein
MWSVILNVCFLAEFGRRLKLGLDPKRSDRIPESSRLRSRRMQAAKGRHTLAAFFIERLSGG